MLKVQLMDELMVKKYDRSIKLYLQEILKQNNIQRTKEETEDIYEKMIQFIQDETAIIVGAIEEELLGFIWAYERIVNHEKRYHVNYFIVNSNYRKKGIGQKLIEEIYKIAKENEIKKVELMVTAKNEDAVSFYKKQEFEIERMVLCKEI